MDSPILDFPKRLRLLWSRCAPLATAARQRNLGMDSPCRILGGGYPSQIPRARSWVAAQTGLQLRVICEPSESHL